MALVWAIQHWRPYLMRRRFTVYTDHRSLRILLDPKTQDQQDWLAKLLGYEFDIVYKVLRQLKEHLLLAPVQMKKYADQHRRPSQIQVGDWVYLRIRPHKQSTLGHKLHRKLASRFYSPFLLVKQVGQWLSSYNYQKMQWNIKQWRLLYQ